MRSAVLAAMMLLVGGGSHALNPTVPIGRYTVRHWTQDDGLPQSTVQSILHDRQGYLWLATQEGIARFDGVRFTVLDRRSLSGLKVNNILSLIEAPDGGLWVGTRGGGLGRLGPDLSFRLFTPAEGLLSPMIRALAQDERGTLWVGTRGGGLMRGVISGNDISFEPVDGLEGARILDLHRDRRGVLWVATEGSGLWRYEDGEGRRFGVAEGLAADTVWKVIETADGTLWIATFGGGLSWFDGTTYGQVTKADGLPSNRTTALVEDRHGNLWVGTAGDGVARISKGFIEVPDPEGPLGGLTVQDLAEDREGSLWIGTQSSGLYRLQDSLFTTIGRTEGLRRSMTRCILESSDGALWIGTSAGGLQKFVTAGGIWRLAEHQPEIGANDAYALHEDADGGIWVGTYEAGVVRLSNGKVSRWTGGDGLPAETVWALEADGRGGMWIGTYGGGLAHLTEAGITTLDQNSGLTSNLVRVIRRTADDEVWVGFSGGGVCRIKESLVEANPGTEEIAGATVFDIFEDKDGDLWMATNGQGLCRRWDDGFVCLDVEHGLHSDMIFRILEDSVDDLWMSCNHGIFRASRQHLVEASEGRRQRVDCTVFGRSDGMPTSETNGGSQPAGWAARDGTLWFPTPLGAVGVAATNIPPPLPPANVVIEAIRADGVLLDLGTELRLEPGTRAVEIDFTALTFSAPEKVTFQYLLEGIDDTWSDAGTRRTAYFNHLRPGRYAFRVRARTSLGPWGPEPVPLQFQVRPFFFQRRSFVAGVFLAVAAGAVVIIRRRTQEHRRRELELESRIADATDELRRAHDELATANRRLQDLSLEDPLTGVANRRRFDQALELLWEQARRSRSPVALLMVDIDHFKAFNDHFGHRAGDDCLRRTADILGSAARRAADLIARYGGEEFAVLLPNTELRSACLIAEELRAAVETASIHHPASNHSRRLTISVGVAAAIPTSIEPSAALVEAADRALYRAKSGGRNRVEPA